MGIKIISSTDLNKEITLSRHEARDLRFYLKREVIIRDAVLNGQEGQAGRMFTMLELSALPSIASFQNNQGNWVTAVNVGLTRRILEKGAVIVAERAWKEGIADRTEYKWSAILQDHGEFIIVEEAQGNDIQAISGAFSTHVLDYSLSSNLSNGTTDTRDGEFCQIVDLLDVMKKMHVLTRPLDPFMVNILRDKSAPSTDDPDIMSLWFARHVLPDPFGVRKTDSGKWAMVSETGTHSTTGHEFEIGDRVYLSTLVTEPILTNYFIAHYLGNGVFFYEKTIPTVHTSL